MSVNRLYNDNCFSVMFSEDLNNILKDRDPVIVTDPPFNIRYHYKTYKDNMDEDAYYAWLCEILETLPFVVIHYPESLYKIAQRLGKTPTKVVSWVYNSNTAKQHRDIAFFDVQPIFKQVTQPYKNPTDKRVIKLMQEGKQGGRLYDWWNINQVKNVSKQKTAHPCQMPEEVMENIIGILPRTDKTIVIDPFMGSGTTGVACAKYGVDFIGIELDNEYFNIAAKRIEGRKGNEDAEIH